MGRIINEVTINAPKEKLWEILANAAILDQYDPTIKKTTLLEGPETGLGAARKVDMLDGKNWFKEKITVAEPNRAMAYELTECTFPIHQLKHSYSFEGTGNSTRVKQVMEYKVKYGLLGALMDRMMMRKQFDKGIKQFFAGLKSYAETKQG